MIRLVEDSADWGRKYNIAYYEGYCPKCHIDVIANIPFAEGTIRGFISEDHGCGEWSRIVTYRDVNDPDMKSHNAEPWEKDD
tara:strand:- start:252 stop:497 length:246 start_codon:yes stop_codon:yes gene_type:complete